MSRPLAHYLSIPFLLPLRHLRNGGVQGVMRLFYALGILARARLRIPARMESAPCACPICGWSGHRFLPYVSWSYVTFDSLCPKCESHPRHRGHRLIYEDLLRGQRGRLLFVAPERGILEYFQRFPGLEIKTSNYGTTDRAEYLKEELADFNYNLMDIDCPDDTWDVIICHRVIEHIPDDRLGMSELHRVLKPGGLLIFSVPIDTALESTVEFGRPEPLENEHFFRFGRDFPTRIPAELQATQVVFTEYFSEQEFTRLGLREDFVFVAEKSHGNP